MNHASAAPSGARKNTPSPWAGAAPGTKGRAGLVEHLQFLGAFCRNPLAVGALMPSSRALAQAMLADCDVGNARLVAELGPGTGAFTRVILDRLGHQTRLLLMELDGEIVARLRRQFRGLDIHNDSAANLPRYLGRYGQRADCVVSGLPWANMSPALQDQILDGILASLSERGVFTTFGYVHARWLPSARRFRERLRRRFGSVQMSATVWRNLPPAFVYVCRQPHST